MKGLTELFTKIHFDFAKFELFLQAVFLREVPWAIQLNDLKEALIRQGITSARVERKRHHVRVEVIPSKISPQI